MTLKRIYREIADLKKEDLGSITVGPVSDASPFIWRARIPGPEGSVYEGGLFEAEIVLPQDYPCVRRLPEHAVTDAVPLGSLHRRSCSRLGMPHERLCYHSDLTSLGQNIPHERVRAREHLHRHPQAQLVSGALGLQSYPLTQLAADGPKSQCVARPSLIPASS